MDCTVHTSDVAASSNLPKDESKSVDVGSFVGVKVVQVDCLIEHLRRHVALSAYAVVQRDIDRVDCGVVADSKSQIANGASAIGFNKNVLRLEVAVSDGRFALCAQNLHVQVSESSGDRQGHSNHSRRVHGGTVQVVEEGAVLVVIGHQPQLSPSSIVYSFNHELRNVLQNESDNVVSVTFIIGGDKDEDIVVSEHHSLVDFSFAEPRTLLSRREDLDSDILTTPPTTPHLTETSFTDNVQQLDLAGDTTLNK